MSGDTITLSELAEFLEGHCFNKVAEEVRQLDISIKRKFQRLERKLEEA
jgi:hypothetical protein